MASLAVVVSLAGCPPRTSDGTGQGSSTGGGANTGSNASAGSGGTAAGSSAGASSAAGTGASGTTLAPLALARDRGLALVRSLGTRLALAAYRRGGKRRRNRLLAPVADADLVAALALAAGGAAEGRLLAAAGLRGAPGGYAELGALLRRLTARGPHAAGALVLVRRLALPAGVAPVPSTGRALAHYLPRAGAVIASVAGGAARSKWLRRWLDTDATPRGWRVRWPAWTRARSTTGRRRAIGDGFFAVSSAYLSARWRADLSVTPGPTLRFHRGRGTAPVRVKSLRLRSASGALRWHRFAARDVLRLRLERLGGLRVRLELALVIPRDGDLAAQRARLGAAAGKTLARWLAGQGARATTTTATALLPRLSLATVSQHDAPGRADDAPLVRSLLAPSTRYRRAAAGRALRLRWLGRAAALAVDEHGLLAPRRAASTHRHPPDPSAGRSRRAGRHSAGALLRVDRPFMVVVREPRSGLILMLGDVVDPSQRALRRR